MFNKFVIVAIVIGALVGIVAPDGEPVATETASALVSKPVAPGGRGKPIDTVLERQRDGHFYVDALVNGHAVRFLVDTGATGVALTAADALRIGLPFLPSEFEAVASGASGPVMGKRVVLGSVAVDQKEAFDVPGAIIAEGLDISLLGQSFLSHVGSVTIADDRMTLR